MHARQLLAILTLTVSLLVFASRPAHAGTQIVNTTADNSTVNGLCSLREAINAANAGAPTADCPNITPAPNTLQLNAGTYTLASPLNFINTSLTIEPNGGTVIIEANASPNVANFRIFRVSPNQSLTLNNLTLRNGGNNTSFGLNGGCVNIDSGTSLFVNNVTFTNCYAQGNGGGAIAAISGGTVQITDSTFTDNYTNGTGGGGALNFNGGASVTIDASSFAGNQVDVTIGGQSGGAIICVTCSLSISDSTFTGNSVVGSASGAGFGGAVYLNTDNNTTITGSTFTNNSVTTVTTANGGAVHVASQRTGDLTITSSVFSGNVVSGATAQGGAISVLNGTLTISDSRIFTNTSGGDGDAVYFSGVESGSISRSCITNNGDTAISDSNAAGFFDATGGGNPADANWWGTSWGPRITGQATGTGSYVSNGDSINGNGDTVFDSVLVDVNLTDAGTYSTPPTGSWLTTPPTVAGAQCMVCSGVSSIGHARACS